MRASVHCVRFNAHLARSIGERTILAMSEGSELALKGPPTTYRGDLMYYRCSRKMQITAVFLDHPIFS